MNHNQKVAMTLEALDMEFEILSLAQQQSIMGGSGGSGGTTLTPEQILINSMFAGGSGGTFTFSTSTNIDVAKQSMLKLAGTSAGMALLTQIKNSGQHIGLDSTATAPNSAPGAYDYGTHTINISNFSASNGQLAAHELFHAYTDFHGDDNTSTSNETQAYLFQLKYKQQSGTFDVNSPASALALSNNATPSNGLDQTEIDYGTSMVSLLKNGYDMSTFNKAMTNFKTGSAVNSDNSYNSISDTYQLGGESQVPLVSQFL